MNNLIRLTGFALLLGCICQNVVFASEPLQSEPFVQRGTSKNKFTEEEDRRLAWLVVQHGNNAWDVVARQMEGRTTRQCRERWNNYLSPTVQNVPWTNGEDSLLMTHFMRWGPKWAAIASFIPGRTSQSVKNRVQVLQHRLTGHKGRRKRPPVRQPTNFPVQYAQSSQSRLPSIDTLPFPAGNR
ncbi:MAG: hypothetical protein LBF84_03565 [Holosporales bacterium]|nr:hypothetical protein [Holosporales bacterium]